MHVALLDKYSFKSPDSGSVAVEYELEEQRDQVWRGVGRGEDTE